jgi:hypothetical protein
VLPMLIRHCDNERLDESNVKKIGFWSIILINFFL